MVATSDFTMVTVRTLHNGQVRITLKRPRKGGITTLEGGPRLVYREALSLIKLWRLNVTQHDIALLENRAMEEEA